MYHELLNPIRSDQTEDIEFSYHVVRTKEQHISRPHPKHSPTDDEAKTCLGGKSLCNVGTYRLSLLSEVKELKL